MNRATATCLARIVAIALPAEAGKLSFDDDVRRFLPELPEYRLREYAGRVRNLAFRRR